MTAYATSEDALLRWPGAAKPTGADLERIESLLPVAAQQLDRAAQRDWYRHPAAEDDPDEVWYATGDGSRILHVHGGIVSLTKLEVRYDESLAYEEVTSTGYVLRGTDPWSDEPDVAGLPFFHIALNGQSAVAHIFPKGIQGVRLTGARGWDAPPDDLVQANVERARQLYSADASYSGAVLATDGAGNPVSSLPALPTSFWSFLKAENSRFAGCWL